MDLFPATVIETDRLVLTPLRVEDAAPMTAVLGDERLYGYIGGQPPTAEELRVRYTRQVSGPGRPAEVWLNWIVRLAGEPVGYVQTTLVPASDGPASDGPPREPSAWTAEVAWVIGTAWQGRGYATEAARGLVGWLRSLGLTAITAEIHPDHRASERVAAAAGLVRTDEVVDGERVWRLDIVD